MVNGALPHGSAGAAPILLASSSCSDQRFWLTQFRSSVTLCVTNCWTVTLFVVKPWVEPQHVATSDVVGEIAQIRAGPKCCLQLVVCSPGIALPGGERPEDDYPYAEFLRIFTRARLLAPSNAA